MGNAAKTKLIVINDEIVCIYSRSWKQMPQINLFSDHCSNTLGVLSISWKHLA
jgi:hypothetical protein